VALSFLHRPIYSTDNANEQDAMMNGIRDDVINIPTDVYAIENLPPATPGEYAANCKWMN
jgi:hypothetical protein